ncbi:hypothetical protein SKAU_G00054080 [Synaphobranchus kaupii]|uniref:Uncharacterized protein n=1 Tax=Synaphobranchus kaupii TaxID=118154 RepID=A0A9Q1G3I9_SYNKA|nr:hypothetical protein SKAU_G00054080 [Synaphobranchus kaupii]
MSDTFPVLSHKPERWDFSRHMFTGNADFSTVLFFPRTADNAFREPFVRGDGENSYRVVGTTGMRRQMSRSMTAPLWGLQVFGAALPSRTRRSRSTDALPPDK